MLHWQCMDQKKRRGGGTPRRDEKMALAPVSYNWLPVREIRIGRFHQRETGITAPTVYLSRHGAEPGSE